jgi:peroxiredoxin 2/4
MRGLRGVLVLIMAIAVFVLVLAGGYFLQVDAQNAPADPPATPKAMPGPGCPMMAMMAQGGMGQGMMGMREEPTRIPLIGETAPAFVAETTQGPIRFPEDYKGKWVILFSHPSDFTPVCTTEFMTFATMMPEFKALNCDLIGLSIDSTYSHIAWLRTIQEKVEYKGMKHVAVTFPLIADVKMDIARKFGMVQPAASDTKAVRAVFFIDPQAKIRALIYYPLSNGRNFQEIKRLLIAMQTSDAHGVATPADWQPGDDVIVPPPGSCGAANDRVTKPVAGLTVVDWFLTFKKMPKSELALPPEK